MRSRTAPCSSDERRFRQLGGKVGFYLVFLFLTLGGQQEFVVQADSGTHNVPTSVDTCSGSNDNPDVCRQASPPSDPSSSQTSLECGLYMAPSSIPNSGWGMYTGISLTKGSIIHPMDLSIQLLDYNNHQDIGRRQQYLYPALVNRAPIPQEWLIPQYDWNPRVTHAIYDASTVNSIIPGLGMLANSHTGLINVGNGGPTLRRPLDQRNHPSAGAFSHYKNMTFTALYDVPAGHELFVEYGDQWFESRSNKFGEDLPLSRDFPVADEILLTFKRLVKDQLSSEIARDLYQLLRHGVLAGFKSRVISALPTTLEKAADVLSTETGGLPKSAYGTIKDVIRDQSWLQENGLCLDHIRPGVSHILPEQHGAFAVRFLPAGTVVAPAPLIHFHRGHLDMFIFDPNDDTEILWRGHQLFLNYVYGHPSTSVMLFPYAPVVNLINHGGREHANVKVRWSSAMSKPEWLNITTQELLAIVDKSGLMMEFIALRDIEKGEEILIDYGDAWQQAWDKHVEQWTPPANSDNYVTAWTLNENEKQIRVAPEPTDWQYPSSVMTVCWVYGALNPTPDDPEWCIWVEMTSNSLADSKPCRVVHHHQDESGRDLYHVVLTDAPDWGFPRVKQVPRYAIAFVDQQYVGHQALRQSFRHEITLPDDMIPETWKDVDSHQPQEPECGLYMAESSIPNAGLGMFTGKGLQESQAILYGEVVIQVEDARENGKLRRWHNHEYHEEQAWLLESYFWQPQNTHGTNEAHQVESIVPGLGMLANSHTGLVNALLKPPQMIANEFNRFKDHGAGASTFYHSLHFVANQQLAAGTELFVPYGDTWFAERKESLGVIPLSYDYEKADTLLKEFIQIVKNDWNSELANDLWSVVIHSLTLGRGDRLRMALPKNTSEIGEAREIGTARYSLPDQRKSLDWLADNGRCLDNIRPGKSQIPQAGRGAFATRSIRNGSLVTAAPVVHFQRKYLEIFDSKDYDNPEAETWFVGMQLLLNYCYGHPESSLVLFPYSPVVNYINHGGENHNARLEWSSMSNHHKDWLDRSPDDLVGHETHAGLILEVVATRDIAPGEEILLDYGENWARAWNYHVENWKPRARDSNYVPASAFNDFMKPVRTLDEQKVEPYPGNVYTACWVNEYGNPEETHHGRMFEWKYTRGLYEKSNKAIWCDVLERSNWHTDIRDSVRIQQDVYVVRVHQSDKKKLLLRNVPRRAIQFFDERYTSDLFYRGAFRHEIGLPDELVPAAWRDISNVESAAVW